MTFTLRENYPYHGCQVRECDDCGELVRDEHEAMIEHECAFCSVLVPPRPLQPEPPPWWWNVLCETMVILGVIGLAVVLWVLLVCNRGGS